MSKRVRAAWIKLLTLLAGYSLAGWVLSVYSASFGIWGLTEAMILYLAWGGTGAIALSTTTAIGIIWIATLFTPCPTGELPLGIPLTGAQGWAIALALSWLLAMILIFKLAFAAQGLNSTRFSRIQAFWLLVLVTNLGLKLGQLVEIKLL